MAKFPSDESLPSLPNVKLLWGSSKGGLGLRGLDALAGFASYIAPRIGSELLLRLPQPNLDRPDVGLQQNN